MENVETAKSCGFAEIVDTMEKLVSLEDLDVVDICTPNFSTASKPYWLLKQGNTSTVKSHLQTIVNRQSSWLKRFKRVTS